MNYIEKIIDFVIYLIMKNYMLNVICKYYWRIISRISSML